MPGYWMARSRVKDPDGYKRYTERLPAIFKKWNARVLSRGGKFKMMEGPEHFNRFVLIEFPTMEDAVGCFESDEYQEAAAFRRDGSGEVETVIFENTEGYGHN
jgi:uncharacterized protein (DUF1330 family)